MLSDAAEQGSSDQGQQPVDHLTKSGRALCNRMQKETCISCDKIDTLLGENANILCAMDGSSQSAQALEWVVSVFMQHDHNTHVCVLTIWDPRKDYLPPRYRKDAIVSMADARCTGYLLPQRFEVHAFQRLEDTPVGVQVCEHIKQYRADFVAMGFKGNSGLKDAHIVGSNVMEVMQRGRCSLIIFRSDNATAACSFMPSSPKALPPKDRPTRWVVSVSLNVAATKAFVDALRLSKPGDDIHVVYIRPFLEGSSNEGPLTTALREKYTQFFDGLHDKQAWPSGKLQKWGSRDVKFALAPQGRNETIAEALVRYANNFEADFVVVGTNALRVDRGKPILGSVSLQIIMEFEGNVVVSNYPPIF